MMKKLPRLPDSELDVMLTLWREGQPMRTAQILEKSNQMFSHDWSISTLQVLLARLYDKGFLHMEKEGRKKVYSPNVSEEQYREMETKNFMERFFGNSYQGLVATLVQTHNIEEKDIEEIARIIRKAGR